MAEGRSVEQIVNSSASLLTLRSRNMLQHETLLRVPLKDIDDLTACHVQLGSSTVSKVGATPAQSRCRCHASSTNRAAAIAACLKLPQLLSVLRRSLSTSKSRGRSPLTSMASP